MLKDEALTSLSRKHNVAQFISFSPGPDPVVRFTCLAQDVPLQSASAEYAIDALLNASLGGKVNIRSFRPEQPKGNPFHQDISRVSDAAAVVRRLARDGYYTIVNETVDKCDGGVSGVATSNILEFSPEDTPRAVELPGILSVSRQLGEEILRVVYGFSPSIPRDPGRYEFSIHPRLVGHAKTHTLIWEVGDDHAAPDGQIPKLTWPNRFSKYIGDKAFGLAVAHVAGLPVPYTVVIPRKVAPFVIGRRTGSDQWWLRTCPRVPRPGYYSTHEGWQDPFQLLQREDPEGQAISSVLAQESIMAVFSGGARPEGQEYRIEGVAGSGDSFMLGRHSPSADIPAEVRNAVRNLINSVESAIGPGVRIEWAWDGHEVWLVQLHREEIGGQALTGAIREPANGWLEYDPSDGISRLEAVIARAVEGGHGIRVTRAVGHTSHVGELLRQAQIPAVIFDR